MARIELDAKGLKCPLPVLRAVKLLKTMNSGDVLVVFATDDAAPADFRALCTSRGYRLLRARTERGVHVIEIERP